jgi:hypothetical protein
MSKRSKHVNPDLMGAKEIQVAMLRRDLRVVDMPFAPDTVTKFRRGYTNATIQLAIEFGAALGPRPRIVWEPIPAEE